MGWNLTEAISYYKKQGAPRDQTAVTGLLREIQQEHDGGIPAFMLGVIAESYEIKETFLLALIKRIPSLRLANTHCLELCAGPNCGKHTELAAYAEALYASSGRRFILTFRPCMRMCGKGPNAKWDGVLYNGVNPAFLEKLLKDAQIEF